MIIILEWFKTCNFYITFWLVFINFHANVYLSPCLFYTTLLVSECVNSYGKNCNRHCSGNCKFDDTCLPLNGGCPRGCRTGYLGDKCDIGIVLFSLYPTIISLYFNSNSVILILSTKYCICFVYLYILYIEKVLLICWAFKLYIGLGKYNKTTIFNDQFQIGLQY